MYIDPLKLIDTNKYKNAFKIGSCTCQSKTDMLDGFGTLDLTALDTKSKYDLSKVAVCTDKKANLLTSKGALTTEKCAVECWKNQKCKMSNTDPGKSCDLYSSSNCKTSNNTDKTKDPLGPNPKQKNIELNREKAYLNLCTDKCYKNPKCSSFIM